MGYDYFVNNLGYFVNNLEEQNHKAKCRPLGPFLRRRARTRVPPPRRRCGVADLGRLPESGRRGHLPVPSLRRRARLPLLRRLRPLHPRPVPPWPHRARVRYSAALRGRRLGSHGLQRARDQGISGPEHRRSFLRRWTAISVSCCFVGASGSGMLDGSRSQEGHVSTSDRLVSCKKLASISNLWAILK